MHLIDYIYYRISLLEFASDGKLSSRGNVYVSFIIAMFTSTFFFALGDFCFGSKWMFNHVDYIGILSVIIFGSACVYFFKRYDKIYDSLAHKWATESLQKKIIKGLICLLSFPLSFAPFILYFFVIKGLIKH